jgi:hypothetical protein
MAATAVDFRSAHAPQRSPEPGGTVARPMLVIARDWQRRGAACDTSRRCRRSFVAFVRESGRTHSMM